MNLNLKQNACKYFIVSSNIAVSEEIDRRVLDFMAEITSIRDEEGVPRDVFFLSRHRAVDEQSVCRLRRSKTDEEEVSYSLFFANVVGQEELIRSTALFKPVLYFVDAATDLFGPISVSCRAQFSYDHAAGYSSRIPIPAPMVSPVQNAVTKIENYRLSHQDVEGQEYSIALSYSEIEGASLVSHQIRTATIIELNRHGIRGQRNKFTAISRGLVLQERT